MRQDAPMPSWAKKTAKPPMAARTIPMTFTGVASRALIGSSEPSSTSAMDKAPIAMPPTKKIPLSQSRAPAPLLSPIRPVSPVVRSWMITRTPRVSTTKPDSSQAASIATLLARSGAAVLGARLASPAALELGDERLGVHRREQIVERLGPRLDQLHRLVRIHLTREALHQNVDLLPHEVGHRLLVAERVVDGEADPLLVAPGAKTADRLDDAHVAGRVPPPGRRQDLELGKSVEHILRDVVAVSHLGRADSLALTREGVLEEPVAELDQGPGTVGILLEQVLDHPERHVALLLELLDHPDPVHELGRVVGHVAGGLHRLRKQALAQVVLDRRCGHARGPRQLAHPKHLLALGLRLRRRHARNCSCLVVDSGPLAAPDSSSAAISPAE